ncbi:Retrovirus-related Pol polyprotein from transposon [Ceratobasidium sp. AG-Ba]|nr:Retrovirus-related Pol polyprotein from transposon [Ceratobasidium sp. AG-Ba]
MAHDTLSTEIEKRWPTPVLNRAAYNRATQEAFWSHKLDVASIADSLLNNDTASMPHQVWASEHLARGMACNSTNVDRVSYTLRHCVDFTVIQLLPKRHDYDDDFAGLCKDIGELNPLSLYYTWKGRDNIDRLLANRLGNLSVAAPSTPKPPVASPSHYAYNPAQSLVASPVAPPAVPPHQPRAVARSTVAQHQKPAPNLPKPTPQPQRFAFSTPKPGLERQPPPHPGPSPNTLAPPRTPTPGPDRSQTPLEQAPPPFSADFVARLREVQNPDAVMPELVTDDTPENRNAYQASVRKFKQEHGKSKPWYTRPYPLTPGTFRQTLDLCTRCARGAHPNHLCPAEEKGEMVPEPEREYRDMLVSDLRRAAKRGRAGAQWGTPLPAQRTKDIHQVTFAANPGPEEDWEQYDEYESGNE